MEHEVFVPVPAERLREVLDDPARVARAVPGLQQDAGAEPVTGRLKIRVGSHSVTYRGAVRVSRGDDGAYAVEGEATEARGTGSVKLALRIALRDAEDGTTIVFGGTVAADGRIKDLPSDAVEGAVTRLLDRFAEQLAGAAPETTTPLVTQDFEPRATTDYETTPDADDAAPPPPARAEGSARAEADEEAGTSGTAGETSAPGPDDKTPASGHTADDARASGGTDEPSAPGSADESPGPAADDAPAPEPPSVFETDTPPSSLGPSDEDIEDDANDENDKNDKNDKNDEGIAEAAHARRTMIGRSAEEVDHAPPRGRYAPVPAPQTVMPPAPLRWAAPAAALALASAIVAVRALRRRR
ncbi:SRPBCC domain-containing protein [Streptomyces coeruleorubidus]|uniref:SRPBCC domain-containing protein n=1 Tax=Streptomyces coeruleorubidus TaxID=116188 RepID=UPI00237F57FF|nr:SRPBCC domain-containing protein [Streptomyces coeruleorubidus]WDV53340.1 SRPBCC domain-containing protein [Streptomyces coeruleorubidus]